MMQRRCNLVVRQPRSIIRGFAYLVFVLCGLVFMTAPLLDASAQNSSEPPLTTDRPGVGDTAYLVPPGYFQLEGGVTYQYDRTRMPLERTSTVSAPNTLLRLGIVDEMELRLLGGEYVYEKTRAGSQDVHAHSVSAPVVGSKWQLTEESGNIPQAAVFLNLTLPLGSQKLHPDDITPDFKVAVNYTFSTGFAWEGNLGAVWEDGIENITGFYTTAIGMSVTDSFAPFVEIFGNMNGPSTHGFDGGFTYLILHNLQVDLSGGPALTDAATDWFIAAGVTYRFPQIW